jgi:hypothetical protein
LVCPEEFSQAIYGNFALAQDGNLFRDGEGTITEIFRKFPECPQEIQEISGQYAGRNLLGPLPPSPFPLSLFMKLVMLMCPRLFNFTLYSNTEMVFF